LVLLKFTFSYQFHKLICATFYTASISFETLNYVISNEVAYLNLTTRKICFALLVHDNRELVIQLIENIKHYCPNSTIVLYNGGSDPYLVDGLGIPICPHSKKLEYGFLARYFLETMEWIEDIGIDYDYFINLDSDALFFQLGFEQFIAEQMIDVDYMGVQLRVAEDDWYCGMEFKKDIQRWEPFFSVNPFLGVFNVGQVFSRPLVIALLTYEKINDLKEAIVATPVFAAEEIVYVNIVKKLNFKMKSYPGMSANLIRFRPHISAHELVHSKNHYESACLCHPIHRKKEDPSRIFITLLQNGIASPLIDHNYLDSLSLPITSSSGYEELVARTGNQLTHYYNDGKQWQESEQFAFGVKGTPLFFESSYGCFEVAAQLEEGGIAHWWRDNEAWSKKWSGPTKIIDADVEPLIFTQIENGDFVLICKTNNQIAYWIRDNQKTWTWLGPLN
jgi:hypothetical protein